MNIINSFLQKGQSPQIIQSPPITNKNVLNINVKEEEKVKYLQTSKNFNFLLQVHGKSIFQNLILTASASINNEPIPIKCKWTRVHNVTEIVIKDINSFSYMPTAEDLGYFIEVTAEALDYPNEICKATYGPITLDSDIKSAVELLLTSGQTHFSCFLYDIKEQEKVQNKEIRIYLSNDKIKLSEINFQQKENILELCKYTSFNPLIKLNPCNSTHFNLKFFDFSIDQDLYSKEYNFTEEENINKKIKSEYNLVAMSKQCRELIYLIIQFFILDERMKNNKIFSLVNYGSLPSETKISVTDLIMELKTLKEENTILMKNLKYLEYINKKLNEEKKNLEEDFQITLSTINCSNLNGDISDRYHTSKDQYIGKKSFGNSKAANKKFPNISGDYETLLQEYNSIKAKETAWKEERDEYNKKIENYSNTNEKQAKDIEVLKKKISILENDINVMGKSNLNLSQINQENLSKIESLINSQKINENKVENKKVEILEEELEKIKKENDKLTYENKNLLIQRNLLNNQKSDISKKCEIFKNESKENLNKLKEYENQSSSKIEELQVLIVNLKKDLEQSNKNEEELKNQLEEYKKLYNNDKKKEEEKIKKIEELEDNYNEVNNLYKNEINKNKEKINEYNILNEKYNKLNEEYNRMIEENKNNLNMSIVSSNQVKISNEEFEEYDQLKKERDEQETIILQMKNMNETKDLEIKKLKELLAKTSLSD